MAGVTKRLTVKESYPAVGGLGYAEHQPHERGFACAVFADKAVYIAFFYLHTDFVNGFFIAEALCELVSAKNIFQGIDSPA